MSKIIEYYQSTKVESNRLSEGGGLLEKLRTWDILERYLPPVPAVIADIGGAEGVYSFPLAERGYKVHLIDIVPAHIGKATEINNGKKLLKSLQVGSATEVDLPDASVDAVLLFGPLYHLQDEKQRMKALGEAYRILKRGGLILAVGISRFAGFQDGVARVMLTDDDFFNIISKDLESGKHINITNNPAYFTDAYFHLPQELASEISEAGFHDIDVLGIEGPVWILPNDTIRNFTSNNSAKEKLLTLLRKLENEPSLIGASAHLMGIGLK